MPDFDAYKEAARGRGALALEVYAVYSTPVEGGPDLGAVLPDHLDYQAQLERAGALMLAGPLSDETGKDIRGAGLIIYRASSMDAARDLANADPMHVTGARRFELRRWLINEGALTVSVGLSTGRAGLL
ncbi:YciI family protein [Albirhodobacter sp. R86504]|uniref:YciI family protein n=1 Tax=Albirhodobacter sp. R86504 TaxID=3093848 RepID=UPI00366AACB8